MPAALSSFTWKDSQLKLTQERYEEGTTDLEYTAWIVNELCQCRFAPVAKILHENKAVQRLFTPHEYFIQGEATTAKPKFDTQTRATSLAVYIFTPTQYQNPKCKQCGSFQSRGPASDCRVPTTKHGAGACTNCYYSGQSTACSLRIAAEQERVEVFAKKEKDRFEMYTSDELDELSEEQLEGWAQMVKDEIENKRSAGRCPIKKRRS
ncbi:hypothetical protein N657DRAFT_650753 [Parathielavia appendiculata]|uniref:Uncharacterized protein n=1 Tax=Parathielavia appendiculata TaxID=2587402 RepID=A0AAN6TQU5_9PEZI|nr:hypothetical protein N657DRAFT_650753 [Parathielavia appendiculata]